MREHIPTAAALVALAMLLLFASYLVHAGVGVTGVVGLGIAGAIGGICAGFTPGYSAQKGTSQTINASTANTTMDGQPPQAQVNAASPQPPNNSH